MKFGQCAHLLNWRHLSKFCHHMMTFSRHYDVIKKWRVFEGTPPANFLSCSFFFTKFCQLSTFEVKIKKLVKFLGHLSGACILQTRVKMMNLAIPTDWLYQFTSNFVKMSDFIRIYDFWKKNRIGTRAILSFFLKVLEKNRKNN